MLDLGALPLPVARTVALLRTAGDPGARALAAFDAAHALTKYVALVRLAAWWQMSPSATARHIEPARWLPPLLWGEKGAGPMLWWRLACALEPLVVDLPATPGFAAVSEERLGELNTARRSRHAGGVTRVDPLLPAKVEATAVALVEGAASLLELPLLVETATGTVTLRGADVKPATGRVSVATASGVITISPLMVAADVGGAPDLYVFERDTTTTAIFENHTTLVPLDDGRDLLAALHAWAHAVARAGVAATIASLRDDELISRLVTAARHAAGRGLIAATVDVARPEVERGLDCLAADGVSAQLLIGASGVGKSHALRKLVAASARVPLWVRAVHWSDEPLTELFGEASAGIAGVTLPAARIAELAAGPGVLIAIDGLNEAADPAALIEAVSTPLRELASGSVHLVITSRAEAAAMALARLEPTWLASGTGRLDLGLLDDRDARRLVGDLRYDELGPATRRLLRVPLLGLLARVAAGEGADALSVDRLVESFVWSHTDDLERAVLRVIAARMILLRSQVMTRAGYDDTSAISTALRECLAGEGALGEAFSSLVDRGLLTIVGDAGTRTGVRVAFGHDRILQWMAGRWLTARPEAREARSGAWGDHFGTLAHAPALALAVGYALLHAPDADQRIPALAGSDRAEDRAVARAAIEAAAENAPGRATALLQRAWQSRARQGPAGAELVALAADLGEPAIIASALGDKHVRDPAAFALSRIARRSTDTVAAALIERWRSIESRPWLRLGSTIRVLHALVHARFAEGASPSDPALLDDVARQIARRLVGTSQGALRRGMRRMKLGSLAMMVRGYAALVPQGPTSHLLELLRMFREPPSERAWLQPLVGVFGGTLRVGDAAPVIRRVARERGVGATILLERALIAASRRPAETDAALDLALEAGALGCDLRPPTMAAQSVLYVLSMHLERTATSNPTWDRRLADFEQALDAWLAAAPDRRWLSESGRRYKSLFVAAHSRLHHRRHATRRTALVQRLWDQAIRDKDDSLAMDLLDDLQILAVSRGLSALALDALEPLLASSWELPRKVHRDGLELLRAIHERAPDVAEEALRRGDERARLALARDLRMGRASKTAGYAIFLDFDESIVLHDDLRGTITRVFDALLSTRSGRGFVDIVLRMAANRVIGERVFAELPA